MLIAAQFIAGAAWGCMLMAAVSAALAIGETGAEGKVVGLVFPRWRSATFARMAAVAGGLQRLPEYAPLLQWAPVACWSVAGAGLLVIAASRDAAGYAARLISLRVRFFAGWMNAHGLTSGIPSVPPPKSR